MKQVECGIKYGIKSRPYLVFYTLELNKVSNDAVHEYRGIDYLHCRGFISYEHAALTAQMKSNSETYLMMITPIE